MAFLFPTNYCYQHKGVSNLDHHFKAFVVLLEFPVSQQGLVNLIQTPL